MERKLTPERRKELKEDLAKAKPYSKEEEAELTFDGPPRDPDRWDATMAKIILEMYPEE